MQCALLLVVVLCSAAVFIWLERKVSARIQDRLGPTRVGGRFGWLQPPADGIKLLCKEDIIPAAADRPAVPPGALHQLLRRVLRRSWPCRSPTAGWRCELNIGGVLHPGRGGLEVFGVILGGYASGSKWSLYGAMREAAQVVSYEIPLGLCVVVPVLMAGTMDLVTIGNAQAGWFTNWNLLHDPFTFVTFWVYVTCATASTNRAPFDLPEAESELVAGFMTEYSGFRWVDLLHGRVRGDVRRQRPGGRSCSSAAGTARCRSPHWLGLTPRRTARRWPAWLGNLLGMCNFIVKAVLGVMFMIWLRWTLPRLRIDQVMTTCLKYCVPLASAMLAGAMLWMYFFRGGCVDSAADAAWIAVPRRIDCRSVRACSISEQCRMSEWTMQSTGTAVFFLLFALVACAFAVAVVVIRQHRADGRATWSSSLAAVAGLFFLAGADFLGAMQLMVYVGGTMVLLVFGVMLTARGPFVSMKTGGGQWIMAMLDRRRAAGRAVAGGAEHASPERRRPPSAADGARPTRRPRPRRLGLGLMGVRVDRLDRPRRQCLPRAACPATCCPSKSFPSTCWSCWSGRPIWPGPNARRRSRRRRRGRDAHAVASP